VQSLLISTTAVAIAEIGDKTQLLSLILAAKYRRPLPICLGILIATLLNHALAAGLGALLAAWLTPGNPQMDCRHLVPRHRSVDADSGHHRR
jgi:putative Ca2+/H+ antiporter (TMEM165/GDT1 family)